MEKNFSSSDTSIPGKMSSDHKPILVCLFGNQHGARGAFRFDKRMIGNQEVREYIHEAWNYHSGSGQRSLVQRFGSVHMNLGSWKRETCNNSRERMNVLRTYLVAEYSTGDLNWEKINFLKSEIAQAFCHEEEFWGQMSRDKWLVVGDNNTSFFHASVKDSRRRNQLSKLTDDAGREATSTDSMGQVEVEYFETLFTSGTGENLSEVCSGFTTKVTEEMNEALIREVTTYEIREAVFGIKTSSAQSNDGLNVLFLRKYWDIIDPDISKEIRAFFIHGVFPQEWNVTHICLIPKVTDPV